MASGKSGCSRCEQVPVLDGDAIYFYVGPPEAATAANLRRIAR